MILENTVSFFVRNLFSKSYSQLFCFIMFNLANLLDKIRKMINIHWVIILVSVVTDYPTVGFFSKIDIYRESTA